MTLIKKARQLMYKQTQKNKAPAWLLTELAVRKGRALAKKYNVSEKLVILSLYLAHTVFSSIIKGRVQKNHPRLSARFVQPYLQKWGVSIKDQRIILNAIEAHHNKVPTETKIAEVMKNAECFKFITVEGALIWLHDLGLRGYPFNEAIEKVLEKMEQKRKLLTLKDCKREAEKNCNEILKIFHYARNQ